MYLKRALAVAVFPMWFWPLVLTAFAVPFAALGLVVTHPAAQPWLWGPVSFAVFGGFYVLIFSIPAAVLLAGLVARDGTFSGRAAIAASLLTTAGIAAGSLLISGDIHAAEFALAVPVVTAANALFAIPVTLATCWAMARLGIVPGPLTWGPASAATQPRGRGP